MKNILKKISLAITLISLLTVINIGAAVIKTSTIASAAGEEFASSHPEYIKK